MLDRKVGHSLVRAGLDSNSFPVVVYCVTHRLPAPSKARAWRSRSLPPGSRGWGRHTYRRTVVGLVLAPAPVADPRSATAALASRIAAPAPSRAPVGRPLLWPGAARLHSNDVAAQPRPYRPCSGYVEHCDSVDKRLRFSYRGHRNRPSRGGPTKRVEVSTATRGAPPFPILRQVGGRPVARRSGSSSNRPTGGAMSGAPAPTTVDGPVSPPREGPVAGT